MPRPFEYNLPKYLAKGTFAKADNGVDMQLKKVYVTDNAAKALL